MDKRHPAGLDLAPAILPWSWKLNTNSSSSLLRQVPHLKWQEPGGTCACSPPVTHNWLISSVIFWEPFSNADPPDLPRGTHPKCQRARPGAPQPWGTTMRTAEHRPAACWQVRHLSGLYFGDRYSCRSLSVLERQTGYTEPRPSCFHTPAEPRAGRWRLPHSGTARVPAPPGPRQLPAGLFCFPPCQLLLLLPHPRPGIAGPGSQPSRCAGNPAPRCARAGPARGLSPSAAGESRRAGRGLPLLSCSSPCGLSLRRDAGPEAATPAGLPMLRSPSRDQPHARGRAKAGGGCCRGGRRSLPGRPLTVHGLLLEERGHGGSRSRSRRTPAAASAGSCRLLLR